MRILILSVDRDDDLGRKAGLSGPVIGREAVLEAATRLALADPEDSDMNCLFATVSTFDDLIAENTDRSVEYVIAAITGHKQVGPKSDAILVSQFERILRDLAPDRLILVSDGAEDEHLLPLIESRIKIDSVRRVVVKQAKNLEGAYYLFIRLFEDEKLQKKFVLPMSLAIIVFGLAVALDKVLLAVGAGMVTLGSFLLIHAMQWESRIVRVGKDFYAGLKTGKVSFFTTILAFALIAFGSLQAYSDLVADPNTLIDAVREALTDHLLLTVLFIQIALWWVVAGLILNILGRALDELVRYKSTKGMYWRLSFSLLALGFILEGLLVAAVMWRTGTPLFEAITRWDVYSPIALGIVITFVGNVTYRYVRDTLREDDEPDEPEGERISMPGARRDQRPKAAPQTPATSGTREG